MTTVRDQLAAALQEAAVDRTASVIAAQVDALLSLPGIAIVAVPDQMEDRSGVAESIRDRPMWEIGGAWTSLTDNAGEIELEADSQNLCGYLSTIAAARSLAAALLAAANAAEATP